MGVGQDGGGAGWERGRMGEGQDGEGQDGRGAGWRIIIGQNCVCVHIMAMRRGTAEPTHLLRIKRVNTGLCQHVCKNKVLETNQTSAWKEG